MKDLPSTTEAVLLTCLLNGEKYGRELREEFYVRTHRRMPFGSLYVTLARMEQQGLVISRMGEETHERGGNRRKYFRIAARGHRALEGITWALGGAPASATEGGGR